MAKEGRCPPINSTIEVREMRSAETCLAIIRTRGERGLPIDDLYRQLFNPEFYLRAYGKIYRNTGAMTPGSTSETVDAMALTKIQSIIDALRFERYQWSPVRRTYIPKKAGKLRPLGMPTWSDKLLQEVLRELLEAYYEPQFSDRSHGFRPGRGCHTALRDIYYGWKGTTWFIEGDIRGCFDNLDHEVLMSILRERILDQRFLRLIKSLLKAGYLEEWRYHATPSGSPQGGIVSPVLANIYLSRLDTFVESTLRPTYNRGDDRRENLTYKALLDRARYLRRTGRTEESRTIRRQAQQLPSRVLDDPNYRRLKYVRYADDFLLGYVGTRQEAETIKQELADFLKSQLRLDLSNDKTLITHARSAAARFLGYHVTVMQDNRKHTKGERSINGVISLRVPQDVLQAKSQPYLKHGVPAARPELMRQSVFDIITQYQSVYRGIVNFYRLAHNLRDVARLHGIMQHSLTRTLGAKLRISVPEVYRRYRVEILGEDGKRRAGLEVQVPREGKPPLVAQWGGISLAWSIDAMLDDRNVPFRFANTTEIVQRLLADTCELCGSRDRIQVHHIRALKSLKRKGRPDKPLWMTVMAARRRKTLVVCHQCHVDIHGGRLQSSLSGHRRAG
jgi:group II intron reverse transcriptase/maturase